MPEAANARRGRLKGKTALVIGAGSSGPGWSNGKAAAVLYAREGARVCCVDISDAAANEVTSVIAAEGGTAIGVKADASNPREIQTAVEACLDQFGLIHVLHNNVGVVSAGGLVEVTSDQWDRTFDINVKSCLLAMKHVIPHMAANGGGSVVNISSVTALRYFGALGSPLTAYHVSKAAVNHLTRVAAAEYASRQVRVNCVVPGLMRTPIAEMAAKAAHGVADAQMDESMRKRAESIPMRRMGSAWDVAFAALFLASEESNYVTGIELVVDGGLTI